MQYSYLQTSGIVRFFFLEKEEENYIIFKFIIQYSYKW